MLIVHVITESRCVVGAAVARSSLQGAVANLLYNYSVVRSVFKDGHHSQSSQALAPMPFVDAWSRAQESASRELEDREAPQTSTKKKDNDDWVRASRGVPRLATQA